jgi:hypothetical protein
MYRAPLRFAYVGSRISATCLCLASPLPQPSSLRKPTARQERGGKRNLSGRAPPRIEITRDDNLSGMYKLCYKLVKAFL